MVSFCSDTPLIIPPKSSDSKIFKVPDGFEPIIEYPVEIQKFLPLEIDVNHLDLLLEIENKHNLKVLPRIVAKNSIYCLLDKLLKFMNKDPGIEKCLPEINELMIKVINRGVEAKKHPEYRKGRMFLEDMIKIGFTSEFYNNLDLSPNKWQDKLFYTRATSIIERYKVYRNKKDFEFKYYMELVEKTALTIYSYPEDRMLYIDDDLMLEADERLTAPPDWNLNPNQVEYLLQNIENYNMPGTSARNPSVSDFPVKSMTGQQLMDKWRLDAFSIINLIIKFNLPTIDTYTMRWFSKDFLNQGDFGKMISGSSERKSKLCNDFDLILKP